MAVIPIVNLAMPLGKRRHYGKGNAERVSWTPRRAGQQRGLQAMSEFLFRQQVTQFQGEQRCGEKIFYQPIALRVFVIALAIVAMCFGAFAALAPLKQTQMVRGHLDPKQGATKVFSPSVGTVTEVLVVEGQAVRKGQVLARVHRGAFDAAGQVALDFTLAQIDTQISAHVRHEALILSRSALNEQQLRAQIAVAQDELDAMLAQRGVVEQRRTLGESARQRQAHLLALGQAASAQYERALDSHYALEQSLQGLQAQIKSRAGMLLRLQQQLAVEPFSRDAQLIELENARAQLRTRRNELEVERVFSLIAPNAGVVGNLLSPRGASVDPRVPFLTILPKQSELFALLYVPSRALGDLANQQQVMLAYDAYPSRVFGYFPARIVRIADTVVDPREHVFPLELKEPVYLVRAVPDASAAVLAGGLTLRSGMQFSAYVVTGQQSLLQRLLSPLKGLRSRV